MMNVMKLKKYIQSVLLVSITAFGFLALAPSTPVSAAGSCKFSSSSTSAFFPAWYDGLLDGKNVVSPDKCDGSGTGEKLGAWVTVIALNIVGMLLYVVGYASLIFIIIGGFKYMTQGDSSSGTVAARKTIQNAVIGLVISIMSVAIIKLVTSSIK